MLRVDRLLPYSLWVSQCYTIARSKVLFLHSSGSKGFTVKTVLEIPYRQQCSNFHSFASKEALNCVAQHQRNYNSVPDFGYLPSSSLEVWSLVEVHVSLFSPWHIISTSTKGIGWADASNARQSASAALLAAASLLSVENIEEWTLPEKWWLYVSKDLILSKMMGDRFLIQ